MLNGFLETKKFSETLILTLYEVIMDNSQALSLIFIIFIISFFRQQVSWFQNSFPLQPTDRRFMNSRGNRHTLTIRHVMQEDFGNYRFVRDEHYKINHS